MLVRKHHGIRKHTANQYQRQFKLFLAFVLSHHITQLDSVPTILVFIEFLAANALTYRVIVNYVSALKCMFGKYGWSTQAFESPLVKRILRGVKKQSIQPLPQRLVFLATNKGDLPSV